MGPWSMSRQRQQDAFSKFQFSKKGQTEPNNPALPARFYLPRETDKEVIGAVDVRRFVPAAASSKATTADDGVDVTEVPQPRFPTFILINPLFVAGMPTLRARRLAPALSGSLAYSAKPAAGGVDGAMCSSLGRRRASSGCSILLRMPVFAVCCSSACPTSCRAPRSHEITPSTETQY